MQGNEAAQGQAVPAAVLYGLVFSGVGTVASVYVHAVGSYEDGVVLHHALQKVVCGEDILACDVPGFPDAQGGGGTLDGGVFAAGDILVEEVHQFLHLPAAFGFGGAEALRAGGVDFGDAGAVHGPFVLPHAPVDIHALAGNVPLAGGLGLLDSPVQGPVAHAVYLAELVQVGLHVCGQARGVHIVDVEEKGGRLHRAKFWVAEGAGDSCP